MSINMTAIVRSHSPQLSHLVGQKVWITRAITQPENGCDAEALPLFEAMDASGTVRTMFPEEL